MAEVINMPEIRKSGLAVLALLCILLLFWASHVQAEPLGLGNQPQSSQQGVLSSQSGRFVFGQVSGSSKDQFMLDTQTGRIWRIAESGEVGLFLREVPYKTGDGEYSPVPKGQTEKELKMTTVR
jgi:hypothetical protein